jgi:hypothetical protein
MLYPSEGISFEPLTRMPQLKEFVMTLEFTPLWDHTHQQISHLCSMHWLEDMSLDGDVVAALVNTPGAVFPHVHSLTLYNSINKSDFINASLFFLARSFPVVTTLTIRSLNCPMFEWLEMIGPQLKSLTLEFAVPYSPDELRFFTALSTCTILNTLIFEGSCRLWNVQQLGGALAKMPHVTHLELGILAQNSFVFLKNASPILEVLSIGNTFYDDTTREFTELRHLERFTRLKKLTLYSNVFRDRMCDYLEYLYTPPSRIIPSLTSFSYIQ